VSSVTQQKSLPVAAGIFFLRYALTQLSVASAVAIDVAIVATHFNNDTTNFFVTFILYYKF